MSYWYGLLTGNREHTFCSILQSLYDDICDSESSVLSLLCKNFIQILISTQETQTQASILDRAWCYNSVRLRCIFVAPVLGLFPWVRLLQMFDLRYKYVLLL